MKKHFFIYPVLLFLMLALPGCTQNNPLNPVVPTPAPSGKVIYNWDKFVMGADLSYTNEVEDNGGAFKDSSVVKDPFLIFKNRGCNLVRVRLWYDPKWEASLNNGALYSGLQDVEKTIQRAKALGMAVNLDLHYSDTWADPATQKTPAAWAGLALTTLNDSVYQYTLRVLNELKSKNLIPEMIQIGNETNSGMLWDQGKVVNNNWTAFAALLNSGIKAVRDFSATATIKPQIILHVAQFQNADYWTSGVTGAGVTDFDVLGVSHYFNYSTTNAAGQISGVITALKSKFKKKVMIVETAFPWTTQDADNYRNIFPTSTTLSGYDFSPDGQYNYMRDLTQQVIDGGGSGIMYWEPEWITSRLKDQFGGTGSSWDNATFFDFAGNTLKGINYMNYPYKF